MSCPVCKRAKCKWIDLKENIKKVATHELIRVVNHNMAYIEMIYRGHQGSASGEERMISKLEPYNKEIERRRLLISAAAPHLFNALNSLVVRFPIDGYAVDGECSCLEYEDHDYCRHLRAIEAVKMALNGRKK